MNSADKKNNHKIATIIKWAAGIVVTIIVVVVLWLLLKGEETHVSNTSNNLDYMSLRCIASEEPKDFIYSTVGAVSNEHEIKALFKTDGLYSITYNYEGEYGSDDAANRARSNFLSVYHKKMSDNNMDYYVFNATSADVDNKARFSLYAETDRIERTVASLFFITASEYDTLDTSTTNSVQRLYESKGFNCKLNINN